MISKRERQTDRQIGRQTTHEKRPETKKPTTTNDANDNLMSCWLLHKRWCAYAFTLVGDSKKTHMCEMVRLNQNVCSFDSSHVRLPARLLFMHAQQVNSTYANQCDAISLLNWSYGLFVYCHVDFFYFRAYCPPSSTSQKKDSFKILTSHVIYIYFFLFFYYHHHFIGIKWAVWLNCKLRHLGFERACARVCVSILR